MKVLSRFLVVSLVGTGVSSVALLGGCSGGGGSSLGAGMPVPAGQSMLAVRIQSPAKRVLDRITNDTTNFVIEVIDATSNQEVASASPTLAQLSTDDNTVSLTVAPGTYLVEITAFNSFGATVGFFETPEPVTVGSGTTTVAGSLSARYLTSDLSGTLTFNEVDCNASLDSAVVSGTFTLDGNGNVTAVALTSDNGGTETFSSGTYVVNPDGSAAINLQFVAASSVNIFGHLNSSKDVMAGTLQVVNGTTIQEQGLAIVNSTIGTFSDADLASTVGVAGFSELAGDQPSFFNGTIDRSSTEFTGGTITDSSGQVETVQTGGTFSLAANGVYTSSFSTQHNVNGVPVTNNLTVPAVSGQQTSMVSGQDMVIGTATSGSDNSLFTLTNLVSGQTVADLNGTFGFHVLNSSSSGDVEEGTMTFDGQGGLTASVFLSSFPTPVDLSSPGTPVTITGGTYTVPALSGPAAGLPGSFSATFTAQTESIVLSGFINSRNNVVTGTFTSTGNGQGMFDLVQVSP